MQDGSAVKALKLGPQLLGHLSLERVFGMLARLDVTAREVPHVRIPPSPRCSVTKQYLVGPSQDHGDNVMILHPASMTFGCSG